MESLQKLEFCVYKQLIMWQHQFLYTYKKKWVQLKTAQYNP